jgi:hypothetical protein
VTQTVDICRDPDDNFILALGLASSADYLISGDKDILSISTKFTCCASLTPRNFRCASVLGPTRQRSLRRTNGTLVLRSSGRRFGHIDSESKRGFTEACLMTLCDALSTSGKFRVGRHYAPPESARKKITVALPWHVNASGNDTERASIQMTHDGSSVLLHKKDGGFFTSHHAIKRGKEVTAPNKIYALRARALRWLASSALRDKDGCGRGKNDMHFARPRRSLRAHFGGARASCKFSLYTVRRQNVSVNPTL